MAGWEPQNEFFVSRNQQQQRQPMFAQPPPTFADAPPLMTQGLPPILVAPAAAISGGRAQTSASVIGIPRDVVEYLLYFQRCIADNNVQAMHSLYQTGWNELTERYYRDKNNWPEPDVVAKINVHRKDATMGDDRIFMMLYKELYYRFVYGKAARGPGLDARIQSYVNYNDFFSLVLADEPLQLELPNIWLWDIIDEFIYQFQSFCLYKANPGKRDKEEVRQFEEQAHDTWNIYPVLNMLYSLVDKSQINEQLHALNKGEDPKSFMTQFGENPLYFKLGYFSLIGLLRLHVLLADYEQALYEVRNISMSPDVHGHQVGLYNTVPVCYVWLHYLLAFTHMMRRDYVLATRLFVNALLFIQRTKTPTSAQTQAQLAQQRAADGKELKVVAYDVIGKTQEQIMHLLSICMVLQPQRIDDSVMSQLLEKLQERMQRMHRGEVADFEQAFFMGAPRFISPTVEFEVSNVSKEPHAHQCRVFVEDINQLRMVPILRGYLKLYTTLTVGKLAAFMEVDEEEVCARLMCFKHKLHRTTTVYDESLGAADDITADANADLDFYIDKDMIHVADTKMCRRVGEYFVKHIQKLKEIETFVRKMNITTSAGGGNVSSTAGRGDYSRGPQQQQGRYNKMQQRNK